MYHGLSLLLEGAIVKYVKICETKIRVKIVVRNDEQIPSCGRIGKDTIRSAYLP
jgi:hypothetical protein